MNTPQLDRVILATCTSTSGKYKLFLAEHIHAGTFCYDVGAMDMTSGVIVSRHYHASPNTEANKAEALRIYDQYREQLTSPTGPQETDDDNVRHIIEPS